MLVIPEKNKPQNVPSAIGIAKVKIIYPVYPG